MLREGKERSLDAPARFFFNGGMHRAASSTDEPRRRDIAGLLAPLRRAGAPWEAAILGEWESGGRTYALEEFHFVGPRGGGDSFRVGIFAGIHGDETAGAFAAVRFLEQLAAEPAIARGYEVYLYPLCNPTGFEDGRGRPAAGRT